MKAVLFNTHDLILLTTLATCAFLAGIFTFRHHINLLSRSLLICFFALNAVIALDTLIFWGEAIKYRVFDFFPYFLLLFSFAIFTIGPVLYWYTRSQLSTESSLRLSDYLHLLPAVAAPVYLYAVCFRFPPEVQRALMLEFQIYSQPGVHFTWFISLKKILPVMYGFLCVLLVYRHQHYSKTGNQQFTWLKILVYGFLLVWLWTLLTHLFGMRFSNATDWMGILGNYLAFVLIATLALYDQAYLAKMPEIVVQITEEKQDNEEEINPEHVERIRHVMETEKPFLNPRLTLDRLAALVQLSPREVSLIINRCFEHNFHEYINRYRVEEAKRMLIKPAYQSCSIQKVAQLSGFNSKATFNRFFKNFVTVTPSEYREQHLTLPRANHSGAK